ncbi:hypothetical protein EW093_11925 [Thiospirochaeta perfilievii]|uniref:6-phosphogluconate dehydrogenase NADP-binding domain-containing protein n=1 Tax=Thiospirochaeta perfilievii TaxID=252967 RepID=A0A5C1QDF6_9SPIO|nr:NAD(P)-binding domain-containing protein [Thiospirochaeta perfilievii]QEN05388.1 hypothetical protein EW093_11925 [Thiospirochaeta perfilievii]
MKSIGFIGLGEMGYALLSNLMSTNSLDSYNVLIYNRSINKAKSIKTVTLL